MIRGRPGRRGLLAAAAAAPVAAVGAWGGYRLRARSRPALLSAGVLVGPAGGVLVLEPGQGVSYVPATRLPADPAPWGLSAGQRDDLAARAATRRAGAVLPRGRWAGLAGDALSDLLVLTGPVLAGSAASVTRRQDGRWAQQGRVSQGLEFPPGAVVAGPVGGWRYVWPRDASFAAAALSSVGLHEEALGVLGRLAAWQDPDGGLQARYTASGVAPDDRPAQSDGVGWLMWAAGRLLGDGVGTQRLGGVLGPCLRRSTAWLLRATGTASHLPAASPDYWEVPESVLTLGTGAAVLLGLEAARELTRAGVGTGASWSVLEERVVAVRQALELNFAPGWGRHVRRGDVDAAVTFVLPPFTEPLAGAYEVRLGLARRMSRPAGGVAPGSSWRDDGISWTPQTAMLAWSAAALGLEEEAGRLLAWLQEHRTPVGALPEKVLDDGSPAGPAPLAWTSALVLLAAGE